ncbi:MAG TPA: thioredoxin domain-containing protein [Myxococcales bacterium]|nr:thioredoxin domain-containing protein [Myxococcales bacterium]
MNSNWKVAIAACIGAAVGFGIATYVSGGPAAGAPLRGQNAAAAPSREGSLPPGSDTIYKAIVGVAPVKGDPDAKVTIVEFSDFQCPYCGRVMETVHQIERTYGKDVRIAFKHNPLPMHPDAPYAARAAIAAGNQGKFWEMHDKLFEANVSGDRAGLKPAAIEKMAKDLGLDMAKFNADVKSSEATDIITSDQAQARQLGAYGTPSFFINGVKIAGAVPFETFKAVIDAQKKRADEALSRGVARKDLYDNLIKDGQVAPAPTPTAAAPQQVQVRNVEPGDGPSVGPKHAKVTIVEWSDFQCPFCGRVDPTVRQILSTYKDDVRLVWRNEPLPFHPNALPAAKAAMAAHKQGKFWQMHELMFAHQNELSEAKYEEWAKQIGLDVARWKADKDSPAIAEAIQKDNSYGQQVGANGTPSFFINGKLIAGALPFDAFKTVIDEQIAKANELTKKGVRPEKLYETIVAENVKAAGSTPEVKVDVGNAPVLGPKNAAVTIVEWSDFQCPYCGRVEPTLQQVREEYKGKVRLAWKNQPLSFHPNAMPAAEAAMAADEQGKFWEYHDALFKRQNELGPALYDEVAKQVGLDMEKFHASIQGHKHLAQIKADMAAGSAVGADGTPTFFINGKKLVGAMPLESFKQVIDAELAAQVAKK